MDEVSLGLSVRNRSRVPLTQSAFTAISKTLFLSWIRLCIASVLFSLVTVGCSSEEEKMPERIDIAQIDKTLKKEDFEEKDLQQIAAILDESEDVQGLRKLAVFMLRRDDHKIMDIDAEFRIYTCCL